MELIMITMDMWTMRMARIFILEITSCFMAGKIIMEPMGQVPLPEPGTGKVSQEFRTVIMSKSWY